MRLIVRAQQARKVTIVESIGRDKTIVERVVVYIYSFRHVVSNKKSNIPILSTPSLL